MPHVHRQARTTPATRVEIARSAELSSTVARRYGISAKTVHKWREHGVADCLDHSKRSHRLPWKATYEERAILCTARRATNFPLDVLTFVVCHFLPHLNRDSIWRILKTAGLGRRPEPSSEQSAKSQSMFRDYDLGLVHIDIKHRPKLQTADGESTLPSRMTKPKRAIAFFYEAASAFSFPITHVLTDNGSCFIPAFAKICTSLGAAYRHIKPRIPQTSGMVERFNGRVISEVSGINIYSNYVLEQVLRCFNVA